MGGKVAKLLPSEALAQTGMGPWEIAALVLLAAAVIAVAWISKGRSQ